MEGAEGLGLGLGPLSTSVPCCCGRRDCAILLKNAQVVEDLERDVQVAAREGHNLLLRHEAYMVDAEHERSRMTGSIEKLESEKLDLESRNATTIQENRELLTQLEELNDALAESDVQVKSLTATLESTQYELKRLAMLSARTESLEQQLEQLEREQASLQNNLAVTTEDKISAVLRWQKAERTIANLQEQMDQIEREAKDERERHIEVVGRMERRRAVEKELETAAGRLKGAAAMKTTGNDKNGSNVVSHFVKDILQDNANLQMGIVELREMLSNSNDEVERLREQIILHQPVQHPDAPLPTPTLESEMKAERDRDPELHIHHHYHAPAPTKEDKTVKPTRRVKKRRHVVTAGHFTPPTSRLSHSRQQSAASTILQQTSVTIPHTNRWSIQSNNTGHSITSSMPSSPRTHSRRESSIFDRVFSDAPYDSSRPTTPDSTAYDSPPLHPIKGAESLDAIEEAHLDVPKPQLHRKSAVRNFSAPLPIRTVSAPSTALATPVVSFSSSSADPLHDLFPHPSGVHQTIPEEAEADNLVDTKDANDSSSLAPSTSGQSVLSPLASTTDDDPSPDLELDQPNAFTPIAPKIRRVSSNESILSLSGMDINVYPHSHRHTLSHRPSHQLLSSSPGITSSGAVLSANTAKAQLQTLRGRDSRALLSGYASTESTSKAPAQTLTSKVGGWISGKWGATPEPSPSSAHTHSRPSLLATSSATMTPDSASSSSGDSETPRKAGTARPKPPMKLRSAGVNQSGPIFGFFGPEPPTPFRITVGEGEVDRVKTALGEALGDV